MKKSILLISFLVFNFSLRAQIAYYDAIELAPLINISEKKIDFGDKAAIKILRQYIPNGLDINKMPDNEIMKYIIESNTYFTFNLPENQSLEQQSTKSTPAGISSKFANIAKADATMVSDALAKFLITRAKAELTIAFFDRFKKFTEKNEEIQILFPKTCAQLVDILSIDYEKMLNVLREKFIEDLDNLPNSFIEVADKLSEENELPELKLAVNSIRLAKRLEFLSATEFIDELPTLTEGELFNSCEWCKNLTSSLNLSVILSNSVRAKEDSTDAWVSSRDYYENILSNKNISKTFYWLLQLQIMKEGIVFNDKPLISILTTNQKDVDFNLDRIEELIKITESVEKSVAEIKNKNASKIQLTAHEYYKYVNNVLSIANFGNKYYTHYSKQDGIDKYIKYAESANNLYLYTADKRYSEAFAELISILEYSRENSIAFHNNLKSKLNNLEDISIVSAKEKDGYSFAAKNKASFKESLSNQDNNYINGIVLSLVEKEQNPDDVLEYVKNETNEEKNSLKKEAKSIGKLKTFGILITGLAEAENSDQAAKVLEAAVLPVGSSALRKKSKFTINVSSYVGARTTFTYDVNSPFETGPGGRWITNLSAPIGIDFGYGLGRAGSVSLNVIVLDIGAIVDYRLSNDSSAIESKISWGNIFSPGASLMYGLPGNIPIAVGLTAQYGPGLTSVSVDKTTVNTPAWRYGFIFAIDIPLFNFVNVPKYKMR